MAKLKIARSTTSKLVKIFLQDSSSSTGLGLTGLTNATAGLTCYYIREGDGAAVAIALVAGTLGTWSSGGFIQVDATNMPGVYELGLPNAVLSSGASTLVMLRGATNLVPTLLEVELDAVNYQDAVRFGLTALPNAAANAAGGLPVSIAGALDLDEMNVDIEAIQASTAGLTFTVAGQIDANVLDWKSATAPAMTGDAYARLGAPAGASIAADLAEIEGETDVLLAGVTIGGYAAGQDPATLLLVTPANKLATASAGQVNVNLAQALAAPAATDGTQAHTLGEALTASRAQGFGKWAIVGTQLRLYAPDGTTIWRTFVLDSATVPTSRS